LGQPLQFSLIVTDADANTTLTYAATGLPTGAQVDPSTGVFAWTPGPAQAGDYPVLFSVSDGTATTTRTALLRATAAPVLPQVRIELTPTFPAAPGDTVLVHVSATSLSPIQSLSLTANGQVITLDSQGRAQITATAPGRLALEAAATDADALA